jgi:hypothetical protein
MEPLSPNETMQFSIDLSSVDWSEARQDLQQFDRAHPVEIWGTIWNQDSQKEVKSNEISLDLSVLPKEASSRPEGPF